MHWILDQIKSLGQQIAVVDQGHETTYTELLDLVHQFQETFAQQNLTAGDRVIVVGDFGASSTAALLALIANDATIIPMTNETARNIERLAPIVQAEWVLTTSPSGNVPGITVEAIKRKYRDPVHPLLKTLRASGTPGLILFTSGSTGEPKAVVHDFAKLLEKFRTRGKPLRTINFLLFDHWGGLNTLLHTLTSGGVVICPISRQPNYVCSLIPEYEIELLPASPSFLNMMLVSGANRKYDLSSLKVISYGAEPMAESTLKRLNKELPHVEFRQTYGLIELGVLRAKSAANDSLLVKIGGDGYETRVVDGLLEIRAESSMLGYLNAPSPFTDDGFFKTGDRVEVHGEYLRIWGRESEQINVGGEKLFPTEVEAVVLNLPGVNDVVVYGSPHPIAGNIVCADIVRSSERECSDADLRTEIRLECKKQLEPYKVPVKIRFVEGPLVGQRQKRVRRRDSKA